MATVEEKFDMPLLYINHYLHSLLSSYTDINMAKNPNIDNYIPFVPAGITADLDAFYENLAATAGFEGTLPSVIFYDRLLRLRNTPFYVGKREQALYTIHATASQAYKIGLVISQVLDREDVSAQDINKWMHDNKEDLIAKGLPMRVFFRSMKVFQVDESRDLLELQTFKGGTMHKYIVEYDYHLKDNPDFL
jgi:hypothetical protein